MNRNSLSTNQELRKGDFLMSENGENMNRNYLSTDQELRKGDFLMSENGEYKACFKDDGNFVIYKWAEIWDTKTNGTKPHRLLLQKDTDLVIYDTGMKPLWATGSYNKEPSDRVRLTLTNDGQLVIDSDGKKVWNYLSTDQELRKGDFLMSENSEYKACFKDDGNFVIYKWAEIWGTKTNVTHPHRLLLQKDTNLVIYDTGMKPLWASGSYNKEPSDRVRLTLTNDGQLEIDSDGEKVWSAPKK
ncbi:Mannose-specific lectin [Merluccius polli]|uniref:Mannose-specific lectin n=1 Tax=Merluccius polli TaxID=89951 RepID=A0AA47NLL8_MERPO|nr:Mannose-specific lectin [Merluccius polli]